MTGQDTTRKKPLRPLHVQFSESMISLPRRRKVLILLAIDMLLVPLAFLVALYISDTMLRNAIFEQGRNLTFLTGALMVCAGALSYCLGLPKIKLNAYEQSGIQRTAAFAALIGTVAYFALSSFIESAPIGRYIAVFTMALAILAVGSRIVLRNIVIHLYATGRSRQRIIIYGAGQTGVQLATALKTDDALIPMAFVDDNKTLQSITVAGLPVHSSMALPKLVEELDIDRIVLAMPSISRPKQARLVRRLEELNRDISVLPSFAALIGEGTMADRIEPVNPTDYLGRAGLENELDGLNELYAGKTVMVTGAGGSIGSELARQVLVCRPERLVLFELSEYALYQIERELLDLGVSEQGIEVVPVLGSVLDPICVKQVIAAHSVNIVLHAAAYKHVPLVEQNPLAGLQNNVLGTKILSEAARQAPSVSHFILISTDKAVHPTNTMGASKRLAELLVQDLATRCDNTAFGIVRFGNVLGSSGSVVPLFAEQIARGGPITLTHEEVTRYFMTMTEAARLVLFAGSLLGGAEQQGDVFLLDMGDPVPIRNLARQMIEASGYSVCDANTPDGDIEIVITGLRAGEKLHEELAMNDHAVNPTEHPKINRIAENRLSEIEAATAVRDLTKAIETSDVNAAKAVVARWVGLRQAVRVPSQGKLDQDTIS